MVTGSAGQPGSPGVQGYKGQKGFIYEVGTKLAPELGDVGDAAYPGNIGPDGDQGITGEFGFNGEKGEVGYPGLEGLPGPNGKNGTDGRDGFDGRPGEDAFLNDYTRRQFQGDRGLNAFKYVVKICFRNIPKKTLTFLNLQWYQRRPW